MLSAFRDRRLKAQASEHARIINLQQDASNTQAALDQLYALIEKQFVSDDEPTLQERLRKLSERRDFAVLARDRAIATSVAPFDIDPATIKVMTQDLGEKLGSARWSTGSSFRKRKSTLSAANFCSEMVPWPASNL
ncbi:hypothetical protein CCR94_22005 [Rhodoblastus sphagnicola]|uniref:Uncharacterized protein n=2 Tax=Rhodoblastus sphagnicola TaxID=333368 RepID=A0A2S6MWA3_9HYPH|nr:hypothetical protein CCR94_22005 [Rhodoblastus sphagnicola]